MKKLCPLLLAVALLLALCACGGTPDVPNSESPSPTVTVTPSPNPTETPDSTPTPTPSASNPVETPTGPFTAPEGTVLCGVDVSGMLRDEALAAITAATPNYSITLNVSGKAVTISGESVTLTLDETLFNACWQALENGSEYSDGIFTVTAANVESTITAALEYSPKNPYVAYSSSQGKFVVMPGTNGMDYEVGIIAEQAIAAMSRLAADCTVSVSGTEVAPSLSADDSRLTTAAEAANRHLTIPLSYSFIGNTDESVVEQLTSATLASFVKISSNYTVSINRSAIESYVSTLAAKYDAAVYTGNFVSTAGETLPYTVKYYGRQINRAALADDIYTCLTTGISGLREAPYVSEAQAAMAYSGSYVEIDLTAQRLWVYKNGVCVVDTPVVTGCVADNNETPTGVYAIYNKAADCWLVGPTWRDHVDYWMPFYGAYGLHDASWRDEFGDEIYIYEGSHGCPNLPVEIAGEVYNNVSIGTPVILYGGLTEPVDLTQVISAPSAYYVSRFDTEFKLEYTLKYNEAEVTLTSDNPEVATVAEDGTVTIHSVGTANITISAAAYTHHAAAELTVEVHVSPNCLPGHHAYGEWTVVTEPLCETSGLQQRICTLCDDVEEQEIPATGHVNGDSESCTACNTASEPGESTSNEKYYPEEHERDEEDRHAEDRERRDDE